jgi:hypothetical protein
VSVGVYSRLFFTALVAAMPRCVLLWLFRSDSEPRVHLLRTNMARSEPSIRRSRTTRPTNLRRDESLGVSHYLRHALPI